MNYRKILYFGLIPAIFLQLVASIFYFVVFNSQTLYIISKTLIFSLPLLFIFQSQFPKIEGAKNIKKSLFYGLFSGLAIFILSMIIFFAFKEYFMNFSNPIKIKALQMNFYESYILVSFLISIVHSFLEEYFWRFFLFRGLLGKFSFKWATIISSIGFSLHHFVILSEYFPVWLTIVFGLCVGVGGMIWSTICFRTKTIFGCWLSHFFVDLAIFIIGYFIIFQ